MSFIYHICNFIAYLIQHGKQGIIINNIEHNLYYILVTEEEDVHFKKQFFKTFEQFPLEFILVKLNII